VQTCLIDDVGPMPVVQPTSVADVCELVRQARGKSEPLFPLGGGTHLGIGLPPARPGIVVDLCRLDSVIDYPARDMTITVQAGISVAALQARLATEHQRLPIDVAEADHATLGGILAANVSGPRRLGFGTLRDYVIGISTVNDEGHEVKAGGRVVKNVAGYDFCKLHIGALGTLGIITQVTLKLRPVPETSALMTFGCSASLLESLLETLHTSRTRPVVVDLFNPAAAMSVLPPDTARWHPEQWLVVVGFEEKVETVRWQTQQLGKEAAERGLKGLSVTLGEETREFWASLISFRKTPSESLCTFKANLLPSGVAAFCLEAVQTDSGMQLQVHAGSGIVIGHLGHQATLATANALLTRLGVLAGTHHGSVTVIQAPPGWKKTLPIWGVPRGDWPLMRQVKDALDPHRLFNPGRFIDAL